MTTPAPSHVEELAQLRVRLARAEGRIAALEAIVEAVRRAQTWDFTMDGQTADEEWLAIDREPYHHLARRITDVVECRPWHTPLESRLGTI